jgi:tRNA/tmRNA/rRNA uracil-C5-methylase (TrmA/RlmC/RlmD family)
MEHTLEIISLAHGGDGIGRIDGQVCFVSGGLPGDTLRVRETRRGKNALWAEPIEVITPSPDRCAANCPCFGRCGGCQWLHFAYPAQAEWKRRIVQDTLARLGGVQTDLEWHEDAALRLGYRTRAELHGDGSMLGFFTAGTHDIIDIPECPLCHPRLNAALKLLRDTHIKGTATVTVNPEGDETLVWTHFVKRAIKDRFPMANTPDDDTRARFMFDGVPVVNGAFAQSSLLLNRTLTPLVHGMIGKASSLLDCYCGSGNLSLGLADRMRVCGIDHNREAVKATHPFAPGAYVPGGEDRMAEYLNRNEWDVVLLDPPREGAKALTPALARCGARAIVYVSCDPATLARDLKFLTTAGWKVTRTAAVDMFPNTAHIETVCRLERQEKP